MKPNPRGTALLYSGGMLADLHGKTSHGLLRYSKRFQILGVVDHKHAGRMSAFGVPPQPVDATQALNLSAGVSNSSVLRGRSLS